MIMNRYNSNLTKMKIEPSFILSKPNRYQTGWKSEYQRSNPNTDF